MPSMLNLIFLAVVLVGLLDDRPAASDLDRFPPLAVAEAQVLGLARVRPPLRSVECPQ